ncbi:unnamed protein product [Protopolystoma xenopodis]|uniref:Uncharacterized protein n=1 Tax=Protopolystoma xenopodis TaxID=117903 RepID=A0A3S5AZX0_9PLAT|nr:unnamed protein product [Protopolystoma xenopodis]
MSSLCCPADTTSLGTSYGGPGVRLANFTIGAGAANETLLLSRIRTTSLNEDPLITRGGGPPILPSPINEADQSASLGASLPIAATSSASNSNEASSCRIIRQSSRFSIVSCSTSGIGSREWALSGGLESASCFSTPSQLAGDIASSEAHHTLTAGIESSFAGATTTPANSSARRAVSRLSPRSEEGSSLEPAHLVNSSFNNEESMQLGEDE